MASSPVTVTDLARDPLDVAAGLASWQRGDRDEAVRSTLEASSRDLHARSYTCWAWSGPTPDGAPAWVLPVSAHTLEAFVPKGPARVLLRCIRAAADAGATAAAITFREWRGMTVMVVPGIEEELGPLALALAHPPPARAVLAPLPDGVVLDGDDVALDGVPPDPGRAEGVLALALATRTHPVRVALTLAAHGQPPDAPEASGELVGLLRQWGCDGEEPAPDAPSLAIEDDPCPRRRHARKVLQRLLRMGKVGAQYHTELIHFYRGAAQEDRGDALAVGDALVRAGLLGEKPSVGQRHVYLRREALSDIHALIDRGETRDPDLAAEWTAPAPGAPRLTGPEPAP